MKNKTILLGILAIFIIIFVLYGYFSSSFLFLSDFKEGLPETIDPGIRSTILGLVNGRIRPDNPEATLTDDRIVAEIKTYGTGNDDNPINEILKNTSSSKAAVDKFARLVGQDIYDPLLDSLVIHYTFDAVKTIDGKSVIENKSPNWIPSNPAKYNAVVYQGAVNPQPISTIIDTKNTAVNKSSLYLAGLPKTDPKTGGNTNNGAYLMIPTIPTCYDSTGFLGMTFSVWFCATEKNDTWCRIFDFANNRDSDNIIMSPCSGNSQCFATYLVTSATPERWDAPSLPFYGDYACDSNWRHAVWTISKSGNWTIYINGRVVSNNLKLLPRNIIRKRNYIGRSNWNNEANPPFPYDDMYNGWIDDFRMYSRELTPEDIDMLYSKGSKVRQKDGNVWVMPDTRDKWYNNNQNERYIGNLTTDLGILSNTRMTIAFWINIPNNMNEFRNVFLIGNDKSHATRLPALYIHPNVARLHFRFSHMYNPNPGIIFKDNSSSWDDDATYIVPLGKDTHITYVLENKTIKFYVNGVLNTSGTLPNNNRRVNNNSSTSLYMNLHRNSQDIRLKNFQIFNRILSDSEVMDVYNQVVCDY